MVLTRQQKRRWILIGAVGGGIILIVMAFLLRPRPVDVVYPTERSVVQAVTASGEVAGAQESTLAPEQTGVLATLLVEEGQRVQRGEVVARISSPELQAELQRAEAAVRTAQARLAEAQTQAATVNAQLQQAQAESANAVRQAAVRVAQAERDLARAQTLATSNATARAALERAQATLAQAEANLTRARSAAANAQANAARGQRLYAAGAISRARLEELQTAAATAQAEVQQAIAQRDAAATEVGNQQQLLQTSRTREVEQAQTALAAARADLAAAQSAGAARIREIQQTPVAERVAQAQAQVAEAQRARDVVQERLGQTVVIAPYAGTITRIINEPGAVVGPGQGVVEITQAQNPEVQIDIDERDIGLIRVGQRAVLIPDAYPRRQLTGVVTRVNPVADPQTGTVAVTVVPSVSPSWLLPGFTVDTTIIIAPRAVHLVIPPTAVMRSDTRASVFIVRQNTVVRRWVVLGTSDSQGAIVLSGLRTTDRVVRAPLNVRDGQTVRPVGTTWGGG